MAFPGFLHHENPPTWGGVEPTTLGTEGQQQTTTPPSRLFLENIDVQFFEAICIIQRNLKIYGSKGSIVSILTRNTNNFETELAFSAVIFIGVRILSFLFRKCSYVKRFNILKDNWGRWKQHSRTLMGGFMAPRKPRVLTLGQS
ncbi:hypothetical protein TNCV_4259711 [Trichonephila clavipes]|nr:hypothetical protein TNCV_4259711 [Trichonephila clavipes]